MKNAHKKVIINARRFIRSIKKIKCQKEFIDGFNEGINHIERRLQEEELKNKIRKKQ